MLPVLILKVGSTLPSIARQMGDYEDWLPHKAGLQRSEYLVLDGRQAPAWPQPSSISAVIVSGSAAMVSDREPWSERVGLWLADLVQRELPVLGVCYGHQLMAQALGGSAGPNPRGREIGTIKVQTTPAARTDPLFSALPTELTMQATHLESVLSLPTQARVLAYNDADPIQAYAIGRRVWGVQFHPEFTGDVSRAYLSQRREVLEGEGLSTDTLLSRIEDSDHGERLLQRFVELVRG